MTTPDFLAQIYRTICKFHDFTIQRHGGLPGFRDEGLLRLAIERPWMTVFGEPLYSTVFLRAAAIGDGIVRSHPFNDGNHRSALAGTHLILGLSGLQLAASANEQRDYIRALGTAEGPSMEDFAAWLQRNSVLRAISN